MKRSREYLIVAALAVVVFGGLTAGYAKERSQRQAARNAALTATVAAAGPLITAIEAHRAKTGAPPPSLAALVPGYLASVPGAGPAAKGGWQYEVDPATREWSLRIEVRGELSPNLWLGFGDTFEYRSSGKYPREAYGGILMSYGKWGYYVE